MKHIYQRVLAGTPADAEGAFEVREREDDQQAIVDLGLIKCREITKKYGTSFYFATQFFPKQVRQGIYAIYAFARIPDEIVDDPHNDDREDALLRLKEWEREWLLAMRSERTEDPILAAIVYIFRRYEIPVEDGEAFLKSMFLDLEKKTYESFEALEEYMYGSAGVIGLMVTRIVGFHSDKAFPYAKKLGDAFQVTNFLRDIKEDSVELDRIYMPEDELAKNGLTISDIRNEVYDERFIRFMKFQIERNRMMYREALPGIDLLKWRGRMAVRIAFVLYKAILFEIERVNYNVYNGRVRTSFRRKVWLSMKAFAGIYE